MILSTHNSLSSYAPKKWWMRLLNPFAKCQSLSIEDQYNKGVRMFDIRVKPFTEEVAHGIVSYKVDVHEILDWLNNHYSDGRVYIRLCCENSKYDSDIIKWFKAFFTDCMKKYPNLQFCGGYIKTGWTKVIEVKDPEYLELYRTFNVYKAKQGWKNKLKSIVQYILHPFPKYWAEKDNEQYIKQYQDYDSFIMLDFI